MLEATTPFIDAAARGDAEAQSILAADAIDRAKAGIFTLAEGSIVAEAFSRMAASHGQIEYVAQLGAVLLVRAGVLHEAGQLEWAEDMEVEGLAWLDCAADCGSEIAAKALSDLGEHISPKVWEQARKLSDSSKLEPASC